MDISTIVALLIITPFWGYYVDSHNGGKRAFIENGEFEVSFVVPNESGWVKQHGDSFGRFTSFIRLIKNDESSNENKEIEAYIIDLDRSFYPISTSIPKVEKIIQEHFDGVLEYRLHDLHIEIYSRNNQCIRIHALLEDARSPGHENTKKWSEQYALLCALPNNQRKAFEIRYYQRYYDNNKDDKFEIRANKLFKSIKIKAGKRSLRAIWRSMLYKY